LLTPIIALIFGKPDFSSLSFTINNSHFLYGDFINNLITFISVAAAVFFFVVRPTNALMAHRKTRPDVESETRPCAECLSNIPREARKCAFCGSPSLLFFSTHCPWEHSRCFGDSEFQRKCARRWHLPPFSIGPLAPSSSLASGCLARRVAGTAVGRSSPTQPGPDPAAPG